MSGFDIEFTTQLIHQRLFTQTEIGDVIAQQDVIRPSGRVRQESVELDDRVNLRTGDAQVSGYPLLDIGRDVGIVILYPVENLQ